MRQRSPKRSVWLYPLGENLFERSELILLDLTERKGKLTTQHKNMNDKFQVGHVGWSPDYGSNKPRHVGWVKLNRMLFIYALDGVIKCLSAEEIQEAELAAEGWKHTATIDPARWIEAMANGNDDPSDMLDELQFSPTNVQNPSTP
jgi:hypothetical protein